MTSTNLNIITVDRRMLNATEAAQYCGLPIKKFPAICGIKTIIIANKKLYDKKALDQWLDGLSQGYSESSDEILEKLT